jgi:hypothetical protein
LLLVKGMTPEIYYGTDKIPGVAERITVASESPDTTAEGKPRTPLNSIVNNSELQGSALATMLGGSFSMYEIQDIMTKLQSGWTHLRAAGGYTSLAQLATVAGLSDEAIVNLVDSVTVQTAGISRGKVNVNTASLEVLQTLPGCSAELAEALVQQREQEPFQSLGEVASTILSEGGGRHALETLLDHVTTKSSCFFIDAMGYTPAGHGYRTLRALVRRQPSKDGNPSIPLLYQMEVDWPLPPPVTAVPTNAAPLPLTRRSNRAPS